MRIERRSTTPSQYAKAVLHGDTIHLAGLIAEDWDLGVGGQCRQVFDQIDVLLAEAGSSKSKLLSMQIFLSSFDSYTAFKEEFALWIDPANLPARATVRADLLDPRVKIEIVAIAAR